MTFYDCDNMHVIHGRPPPHLSILNTKKSKSFIINSDLGNPKSYLLVIVQNGTYNFSEGIKLAQIPVPKSYLLVFVHTGLVFVHMGLVFVL